MVAGPFMRSIVVGASSGIGEALALQLATQGEYVSILGRRQDKLERICRVTRECGLGQVDAYPHDVTSFEEIAPLFEKIVARMGGLDMLVYAAGVMPPLKENEYSFVKDRKMVEVNLLGAMGWLNVAAPFFEARRSGTLMVISSIAGERGRRGNPGYCATKAALSTYQESLRNRLSRYGVNVVTIKPGFVDTAMTKGKPGLFWLISAEEAASQSLAIAQKGVGASQYVPFRWGLIAWVVRNIPSFIFRRLSF
ncbi:SDR family NAD(P)-dependent oxidoreductase [Pajaroellobacter abortibovis]|uniref:Short-chain dehydrogenase n=1 Tax=Pajaroellobacter abortibovis TaxID=1882918 RepID=A0A1L6MWH0_9BACT|nr:SDR family NAD(P)-dependent oxidoreductase [Pajaroellobacter abortibovis]APR99892.1 hypothetical protein BCY86_03765 [Pajaroellobacter abortibovis]